MQVTGIGRLFQIVSFVLALMSMQTAAVADQTAHVSAMDYRPLLYTDKNGEFTGTVGETVKAICVAADIACDFSHLPLKRSILMLEQRKLDATITIDTGQPRDCCLPTEWNTPWSAGFYSYMSPDKVPTVGSDLLGRSLIIVNGMKSPYSFAPKLDAWKAGKALALTHATNIDNAIKMFLGGRAQLLWGSDDFELKFREKGAGIVPPFYIRSTYPIVIWVNKQRPDLRQALDRGYKLLLAQKGLNAKNLLTGNVNKEN